jgi:hypothetical protein
MFAADNPPFGAVFTYYLKDGLKSLEDERLEAEKEAGKKGAAPRIPSYDELRAEEEQVDPAIVLTVRDADGDVVRRVDGKTGKGMHRVAWDLRWPSARPTSLKKANLNPWDREPVGQLAVPGTYSVTLSKVVDGVVTDLAGPQTFEVVDLGLNTFATSDQAATFAFQQKAADLERAVRGAVKWADEADTRLDYTHKALMNTPEADAALIAEWQKLRTELNDIQVTLTGDDTKSSRNVFTPPSILDRVNRIVGSQWDTTGAPTGTNLQDYEWAAEAFASELARLTTFASDLESFESKLEAAGAPWTPGRLPEWSK